MTRERSFAIFLLLILFALLLRLPNVAQRPLHGDEAVHAVKFGTLLEHHTYRYDPFEYHGPTLNYFTLIPAWLSNEKSFAEIDERTLRWIPLFFGVLLVAFLGVLREGFTPRGAYLAMFFTAASPMMVFYSRYYIQEMLFVTFVSGLIIFGYRWLAAGKSAWGIATALSAGLMMATKETWVIPVFGMAVVVLAGTWLWRRRADCFTNLHLFSRGQILMVALGAIATASLFFFILLRQSARRLGCCCDLSNLSRSRRQSCRSFSSLVLLPEDYALE